jgi:hypothetical protein
MGNASFVSIKITKDTYDKLMTMMSESNFKNISLYIEFMLSSPIAKYAAEKDGEFTMEEESELTEEDEEEIKKRLKELGYL